MYDNLLPTSNAPQTKTHTHRQEDKGTDTHACTHAKTPTCRLDFVVVGVARLDHALQDLRCLGELF